MTQDQGEMIIKLDDLMKFVNNYERFYSEVTKIPVSFAKERSDIDKIVEYILK